MLRKKYIKIKKVIDIIIASILLILLMPLNIILAIIIKVTSKGPIIYIHKRIGKNGKILNLYKFRTMEINADKNIDEFSKTQMEEWKQNYKLTNDPRVTKIGKILRKISIDELPQLLNIIKGELALIGPRPITKQELEKYKNNKDLFLSVTPRTYRILASI